ncbi:MAG: AMP-dependent synthetase, partial [Pseudomonadota bacterium]|nr:AMP-dependent synthetase [Pseudomonadota bacterium]
EHSEASAVFIGKLDEPDVVADAIPAHLSSIAFPYPTVPCRYDWNSLIEKYPPIEVLPEPDPDDVMTILYTSGST